MERLKVTPDDAFDLLRRTSQQLNIKLREVARGLAESGEFARATSAALTKQSGRSPTS